MRINGITKNKKRIRELKRPEPTNTDEPDRSLFERQAQKYQYNLYERRKLHTFIEFHSGLYALKHSIYVCFTFFLKFYL